MISSIKNIMKKSITFCMKCKHPINSSVHEYLCDELTKAPIDTQKDT